MAGYSTRRRGQMSFKLDDIVECNESDSPRKGILNPPSEKSLSLTKQRATLRKPAATPTAASARISLGHQSEEGPSRKARRPQKVQSSATKMAEVSSAPKLREPSSEAQRLLTDQPPADERTLNGMAATEVFIRVRPCNTSEREAAGMIAGSPQEAIPQCVKVVGETGILAFMPGKEDRRFTFDKVLMKTSQQDIFEAAGIPMVDNCISGYNSAIFAYGQTGSGKTYTMMGDLEDSAGQAAGSSEQRGLAPRMIELLFERIQEAEDEEGCDTLRYSCRCSCLEIYNETIADLLDPQAVNLQLREDPVKGIYVDGLCEKEVLNVDDVMVLMRQGNSNRHVGETNMNARSSRSHCVFTCVVERASKTGAGGTMAVVTSRLTLVDLAGSERIKGGALGGSQAQGGHFKEAVHINQSLTTLGRVITELMEAQRPGKQAQGKHIPYRDSRLTFLLQDSLGGNAKTTIIANVSPSPLCAAETVSTLQFANRAKHIRNHAKINLNYCGDVELLQLEVARLHVELDNLRRGFTDPAVQENKELRGRVDKLKMQHAEDGLRISALMMEVARIKKDRARMEGRLQALQEASDYQAQDKTAQKQLEEVQARAQASDVRLAELREGLQAAAQQHEAACRLADERARLLAEQAEAAKAKVTAVTEQLKEEQAAAECHATVLKTERGELSREIEGLREELAAERASHARAMAAVVDQAAQQEHKLHEELKHGAAAMSVLMQQMREKGQRQEEEGEQVGRFSGEVDRLRHELLQTQTKQQLLGTELIKTRFALGEREGELAHLKQTLEMESANKCELEDQMKGDLVTNMRYSKVFQEMTRLIQWATTADSSAPESSGDSTMDFPMYVSMPLAGPDLPKELPGRWVASSNSIDDTLPGNPGEAQRTSPGEAQRTSPERSASYGLEGAASDDVGVPVAEGKASDGQVDAEPSQERCPASQYMSGVYTLGDDLVV